MHLQFKFTFSRKIQVNIKNLKNIPKSHRKVPNWNMCFKVLYKCHRKNLKTKIKKIKILCRVSELALGKGTSLPSAKLDTRQRQNVCRVLTASTRQRMTEGPPASPEVFCRGLFFAECLTLGKGDVCRVFGTRQRRPLPSASFAECNTRQTVSLPSARVSTLGKAPSTRQRARLQ